MGNLQETTLSAAVLRATGPEGGPLSLKYQQVGGPAKILPMGLRGSKSRAGPEHTQVRARARQPEMGTPVLCGLPELMLAFAARPRALLSLKE